MDQAELYRPILGQNMNIYEKAFFPYLTEVRSRAEKLLYGSGESMSLTEESQKLNGLKRSGRVKKKAATIPLPPKAVQSQDPNL